MMKAEKPADGILKQSSSADTAAYKICCDCGSENCSQSVFVEADEHFVYVTISTKQSSFDNDKLLEESSNIANTWLWNLRYTAAQVINSLYHRVKITFKVWWHGTVDYQSDIVLTKQQALNYASALRNAVISVDKARKNQ